MVTVYPELPVMDATLRLGAATLAGAALGLNREIRGKSAGLRTHALVALGTALMTLVGVATASGAGGAYDPSSLARVVQGIAAGIGFLGGGAILKGGDHVRGLTTAATLWVAAGVGIACAAGLWHTTLIAVALTTVVLVAGRRADALLHRWFPAPDKPAEE